MNLKFLIAIGALAWGAHAHAQTTTINPPQGKLGTYVVDTGLRSKYFFRGDGPLIVQVPIPLVVNPSEIGPDGYLKNPAKLIANKVIGSTAIIQFPAYDVDDKTPSSYSGAASEKDTITFNGKSYGALSGVSDKWMMQQFTVPITKK
jgi:hypothetical protein